MVSSSPVSTSQFLQLKFFVMIRLLGCIGGGSESAAELAGFYKGLQAAGAAVAFRLNIEHSPLMTDLLVSWGMLLGSLVVAAPVIFRKIKD